MRKITLKIFMVLCLLGTYVGFSQTLNQPANWPSGAWTLTGTYTPAGLVSDPTTTGATFTWDDDAAGNGSADNLILTSPVIDLTAASGAGETWITVSGEYVYRALGGDVLAIEVYDADAMTWSQLEVFTGNSTNTDYQTCTNSAPYTTAVLNIAGYTATQLSGFQYRITYDDQGGWQWGWCLTSPTITSQMPPSCPDPSMLMASNVSDTTALLGWTENGTAMMWDVEIVTSGSPATGTPTASGVGNPYMAMSLTPETAYDFYVRADCGGAGTSAWIGPETFTTACAAFTAPYSEDFENGGALPNCWTLSGDDTWLFNTSGPNHVGNAGTLSGATPSGNYYAVVDDSDPTATNAGLVSPFVDLTPLATPALSFYEISDNEGQANATLTVEVWDGAAWNSVGIFNTNTLGWEQKLIDLSGLTFTGPAQARFLVADSGSFYDDIAIDDVSFIELPSCIAPSALMVANITQTSADFSWTENNGSTTWEVVVQAAGTGTPTGAGTQVTGATATYTDNTLVNTSDYEFFVRTDCGGGTFSTWSGPLNFSTPPTNDDCIDAIALTPGGTFNANPVVATNSGATDSSGAPAPGCASYQGGDVWFSVVVPSDGMLTLEVNPETGGLGDTGGAVYSGTCGALALEACNDDGSASGAHPIININNPALANQTVYFRVWEFGNNAVGEFQVSAYAASLSVESAEVRGFTHYTDNVNNRFVVNAESNISSIEVYNLVGQVITTARPNSTSGFANLSSTANGVYFAKVTLENGRTSIVKFAK